MKRRRYSRTFLSSSDVRERAGATPIRIIGIVVVGVAWRIHIPRIAFTIRVRGTGYYGSYPILNTQSVNTILSFFNFPLANGYQLFRLFTTTLD